MAPRSTSPPPSAAPRAPAADLELVSLDAIPAAAIAIVITGTCFFVYNAFTFPAASRVAMLTVNALVILMAATTGLAQARKWWSPRRIAWAAVLVVLTVGADAMLAGTLRHDPSVTFYVGLIVIGAGNVILVPRVALAVISALLLGWIATSLQWMNTPEFVHYTLVLGVSGAVAFILQRARTRTTARVAELSEAAVAREQALEQSLGETEAARSDLDRKVDERTAELQTELAERRRVEAESARLGDQLRHAQKMEAVGRLAGGVAHDFNNLLTVLRASLEVASQHLTHDSDADEALRDASDATDRAAALTRDLLAFGRKQTLERAAIDASEIMRTLERMIARVASEKIRVVTEAHWRDAPVLVDRGQIEQVLLNLALNARDAMPDGGTLRIAVLDGALTAQEAKAREVAAGAYVRIVVSDTGTGMDDQTRAKLFEPFFTTKPLGRGTGLGLAVAHGIVTQHGGVIDVSSALGAGSTFEVWLPRMAQPLTATAPVCSSRPPRPTQRRETILVVEDEPGVRRATVRILRSYGYEVLVADDGASALIIAAAHENIDLVVSDVVMPDLDGPAVVARLRERWPALKALFVSGYTADHFSGSSAVRNDPLLQKPYRPKDLANAVTEAMYGVA